MSKYKYVGMDIHQASSTVVVQDERGKCVMETIMRTKADTIRDFINGISGTVHVAFEEGTQAAWLYDIIKPLVAEVVVCDPRANKLFGNKGDRIDARKLADLLRAGLLRPVYHGGLGTRRLKELVRNYENVVSDSVRVMSRLKAIFRGRGISYQGRSVYDSKTADEWLKQLMEPGARTRAEFLYDQLKSLRELRRKAKKLMLAESRHHSATKILASLPGIGLVRAAQILATVSTPYRFRTTRQLWTYSGFAVVTRSSSDYILSGSGLVRRSKRASTRGLNKNYNRRLKAVFKGAALIAIRREPFKGYWEGLKARNLDPDVALVSVARKLSAVTLAVWKKGEAFDVNKYNKSV